MHLKAGTKEYKEALQKYKEENMQKQIDKQLKKCSQAHQLKKIQKPVLCVTFVFLHALTRGSILLLPCFRSLPVWHFEAF